VSVILVSNRVADPDPTQPVQGGLAAALLQAVTASGAAWVGTRVQSSASDRAEPLASVVQAGAGSIARVEFPTELYRQFYGGFANSALWPVLHSRPDLVRTNDGQYAAYCDVNRQMALALKRFIKPNSKIWVHDYHFLTVAKELRDLGVTCPVGFFLHTPFPQRVKFTGLPHHRELANAMLHYDLLGFQTADDQANFTNYVERELRLPVDPSGFIATTATRLGSFPIGIDVQSFVESSIRAAARPETARLRASLQTGALAIGVDRIDYSKGLRNRLRAFDQLFQTHPDMKRKISLLQIALPSRSEIETYSRLQNDIATLVSDINGRHGEVDWMPIRYLNKGYPQSRLAGLYRTAQIGLVTPLVDGMNLVAKEYVAAQNPLNPGVLILSEFAGAARQLDAALLVNPNDIDAVVRAVCQALTMDLSERRERFEAMIAGLKRDDIHSWYDGFLATLTAAPAAQTAPFRKTASRSTLSALIPNPFGLATAKSS
jgi:trehalose 6-phosphate synthase